MSNAVRLNDYGDWVGRCPLEIRRAVIARGGWSKVFPRGQDFPKWANRIRNYFNLKPKKLKLIKSLSREWILASREVAGGPNILQDFKSAAALSGDLYIDEFGRHWFEMRATGAIYHYKGKVDLYKKVAATLWRQEHCPVFKLISPDGTGGSCEICLHNWQLFENLRHGFGGKSRIGKEGQWINVRGKHVVEAKYQGSYNYSEIVLKGDGAHNFMDVNPHKKMTEAYVDPPLFQKIESRRFPAF